MNMFRVMSIPFNCINSFFIDGSSILWLPHTSLGSPLCPSPISKKTTNLPAITLKVHFSGLIVILYCQILLNTLARCLFHNSSLANLMIMTSIFYFFAHFFHGNFIHHSLVRCTQIFQAKKHDVVLIVGSLNHEDCLVSIRLIHKYLVVYEACIHEW